MTIFSMAFFVLTYWQMRGLEDTVREAAQPAQLFCKNLFSFPSPHLHFYQAVACGISLKDPTYAVLKTVSLWHLIVVSGGHFQVLLWILKKLFFFFPPLIYIALTFFTLMTGAQPPVVRAYTELLVQKGSQKEKLWIPRSYQTLYSASLVLIFFPQWCTSWSFLLSWLCALLILLLHQQPLLIQALGMAIGVFPVVCFFSTPHPLSFLFNLILGPPLAGILFPLTLLMIVFPFLHYLGDWLLSGLLFLLNQLVQPDAPQTSLLTLPSFTLSQTHQKACWIYLLILQIWVLLKERKIHYDKNK